MGLNLDAVEKFSGGEWVQYDEDVSFKLRPLTPKLAKNLKKQYTTIKTAKGGRDRVEDVNEVGYNASIIDTILIDWKGVTDKDGKIVKLVDEDGKSTEGAKELKLKLTDNFTRIGIWILEQSNEIAERIANVEGGIEKN